jgi:hypothetical protein
LAVSRVDGASELEGPNGESVSGAAFA